MSVQCNIYILQVKSIQMYYNIVKILTSLGEAAVIPLGFFFFSNSIAVFIS